MKQYLTKAIAAVLLFAMLPMPVKAAEKTDAADMVSETAAGLSALGGKPGKLLSRKEEFPAGTSACDWVAIALALSGSKEHYGDYLDAMEEYVEVSYEKQGGLERVKSTTYHRIALTVLALGGDPTRFGTKKDGTPIDLIAEGTYAFGGDSVGAQGLNGWIYALLTLDASGVQVPRNAKFSRENMIEAIVTAQEADGGFGLGPGSSNVDITAMALQALAPYSGSYPETVEAGLAYLAEEMDANCRYSFYGAESVESSAQVILALCALGIDPEEDARFARGEQNILTALASFRQADGTYGHTLQDTAGDYLATAQTLMALEAVDRLRTGEGWIFDFAEASVPVQTERNTPYCVIGIIAVAAVAGTVITGKRRKHGKNNG